MTGTFDTTRTDPRGGRSRSSLSTGLNLVGLLVVGFWLVVNGTREHYAPWVYVVGGLALVAWVLRDFARRPRAAAVASGAMVVLGAAVVVPSDSLLVVPAIVGVITLQAATELPVWTGLVAAVVASVEIGTGALVSGSAPALVLGNLGGLLLGVLIGFSRRQARLAEDQARQAEREAQRSALLAEKSRAARDVHDVLAHSLGGLVLQLDAVEALLEAGRVDDATARAGDARRLAVDGLAEARRAVAALREDPADPTRTDLTAADRTNTELTETDPVAAAAAGPATPTPAADVASAPRASRPAPPDLQGLVDAHRAFGGEIVVQGDTTLAALDDRHAAAVVAVSREALSNARRHAPGRPVSLSVIRDGDAVDVVVANPIRSGGHGLVGMRERFAELGDDSTIEAEHSDDEFVVAMHVAVAETESGPTADVDPAGAGSHADTADAGGPR